MGTWYTFKCNKCGYEVQTSGGHACGFLDVVDTYICEACKEIVDVSVGEYGKTFPKEEIISKKIKSAYDLDFYVCPECGSDKNLIKWNNSKRPCPRCDGKMEKDADGEIVMWD